VGGGVPHPRALSEAVGSYEPPCDSFCGSRLVLESNQRGTAVCINGAYDFKVLAHTHTGITAYRQENPPSVNHTFMRTFSRASGSNFMRDSAGFLFHSD
jgi:hypothetical protein